MFVFVGQLHQIGQWPSTLPENKYTTISKKKLIAKIRECEASLHYPKKTTSAVPGTVNFLVHKVNNKKLPY